MNTEFELEILIGFTLIYVEWAMKYKLAVSQICLSSNMEIEFTKNS